MNKIQTLLTMTVLLFGISGSGIADFNDGSVALKKGDYKTAFNEWEPLAEQGDALAQLNLGIAYYFGKGVLVDKQKAVEWWEKAAEQGDSDAQNQLGVSYEMGDGVLMNYNKSAYWYKKSAEQGNPLAQYSIGSFYIDGLGVRRDLSKVKYWYEKAYSNQNLSTTIRRLLGRHWESNKLWKY